MYPDETRQPAVEEQYVDLKNASCSLRPDDEQGPASWGMKTRTGHCRRCRRRRDAEPPSCPSRRGQKSCACRRGTVLARA